MKTITAVIQAKAGEETAIEEGLLMVAEHVKANEPETVGFFISRDAADPARFTTYERFTDQAAMDRHNGSPATAKFFEIAEGRLDGEVILVTCDEISAK